ncbi:unnamed protein product, partial [Symbiodinium sp. CCMP2456]
AAAAVEDRRVKKRKLKKANKGEIPEEGTPKEPKGDDDHDRKAGKGQPKRKRVNKLLKGGGPCASPPAAAKAKNSKPPKDPPASAKRRVLTPRKKSKKLNEAHKVLESLRAHEAELPGLLIPAAENLHRSYTVYHQGPEGKVVRRGANGTKAGTSSIGVILVASSFYVKQVLVAKPTGPISMDGKGGATVPWHAFDAGLPAAQGYDRGRDPVMEDLGNNQGFMRALALVLRLKPGGLLFAGLPCNSFAFMSKGSHKRTLDNPMGANHPFVITGNLLASRACLLFLVALIRSTCWALENPARSTVPMFPYLEKMMGLPLFRHASVFWWCPQLLYLSSCSGIPHNYNNKLC